MAHMHYKITEVLTRTIEVDADTEALAKANCKWRRDWDEEVKATIVETVQNRRAEPVGPNAAYSDH